MSSEITPHEAASALASIDDARLTMRRALRAHRGHFHLWIWGAAWIAMPLLVWQGGERAMRHFPWICLVGALLSAGVAWGQSRQVKIPINARFVCALLAVIAFGVLFPLVLGVRDARALFAYICLLAMQAYVVAGLWTDTYLLWLGLVVCGFILLGYFVFPEMFWPWMAACGGGSLILTGFYVRHFWR